MFFLYKLNWKRILISVGVGVAVFCILAFGLFNWAGKQEAPLAAEMPLLGSPNLVEFALYRTGPDIPVTLSATSVERDLTIYILDEELEPVPGVGFQVEATDPEGNAAKFDDKEKSGRIYVEGLQPGDYTIALMQTQRYITPEPVTVQVKDKVERVVIANIEEKIVSSSDVNAPAEDGGYGGHTGQAEAPSALVDTIEFYESNTLTIDNEKTVPLLDENGNQIIRYRPVVSGDGFLLLLSGDPSEHIPEVDMEGYCLADAVVFDENGQPVKGEDGAEVFQLEKVAQTTVINEPTIIYQGWQTLDGNKYYFDLEGNPVTGPQVIQGVSYVFSEDGIMQKQLVGIDVSTYQTGVNWANVRDAGVHFAMIRAGYRGYGTGVLVEDDMFRSHAAGASAAGIKVGVYYFTQAINEKEAVEEASACIAIIKKYGIPVSYPIAIDVEFSNGAHSGRADRLSGDQRTRVAEAFCETIRSAGYTPMIYSSKSWFESSSSLITSRLAPNYKIWVAHWTSQTNYAGRMDMWQYTSSGSVPGIPGRVDMNISYLGY